ncbi:MAG: bifunctional riboflavin kinase/FAD synthetase [Pseudolabrys sp.]|nr:bifunctional riboflavin kinase/FAD synthetase [Pseudolabrys sp.]
MITTRQPGISFAITRDSGHASLDGAVLAIGNFDGVHRGHRAVIAAAQSRARALARPSAALTFSPHPRAFLRPQEPLFLLNDERSKMRLLAATGLNGAIIFTFDAAFAATSAEDFVEKILVERLQIGGAAIGFDFHFGKNRGGSPDFLRDQGQRFGFAVDIVPPLEDEGRPVSSGAVRTALAAGKVVEAAELLGAPWFVSGIVVHGEKRGRDLGFPTANIKLDPSCALKHGIYAVRVSVDGKFHDGVASFGRRPTFDNGVALLEVYLFDFAGDLYGRPLDVAFIGWIRPEHKFDNVEDLKRQMRADSARAGEILARSPGAFPAFGDI